MGEGMVERFGRCRIAVIADFRLGEEEAMTLREHGAETLAVGLAGAETRKRLEAAGIDVTGIRRSRRAVLQAAVECLGAVDAVLFGPGEWEAEFRAVREAEREAAYTDGRFMLPVVAEVEGLQTARARALFVLARAAGASAAKALEFAGKRASGHQKQDPGSRKGGGAGKPAARQTGRTRDRLL